LRETLRNLEYLPNHLSYKKLVLAAGNVQTDPATGARAIYFLELQNAQVGFEARPGPDFVPCTLSGGTITAKDDLGQDISPILTTAYVQPNYANATAGAVFETGVSGLTGPESAKLLGLPDLAQIEASTILAKQAELVRTLGLVQENYYLDQSSYINHGGQKLLAGGRMRIYSDPASVGTNDDVIATYLIAPVWSGNELQTYKVTKQ